MMKNLTAWELHKLGTGCSVFYTRDIIMSSTSPRYMKASPLVVYSMLIVRRNIKHEGYSIK